MKITKKELSNLIYQVNGAAIEIHKTLGPGLLESVYHKCMMHELKIRGISFDSEMIVPVSYKGLKIDAELRCDLMCLMWFNKQPLAQCTKHPIFVLIIPSGIEKDTGHTPEFDRGYCANFPGVALLEEAATGL